MSTCPELELPNGFPQIDMLDKFLQSNGPVSRIPIENHLSLRVSLIHPCSNLAGNNIAGPILPAIGGLTNLTMLVLYDNKLNGGIPPELGNLTYLYGL
jgi:hypothetical protein